MAQAKKGLGRGLSALIPTDMDFLAEVARGDFSVLAQALPSEDTAVYRETSRPTDGELTQSTPQVLAGEASGDSMANAKNGSSQEGAALEAVDPLAPFGLSAEERFGARDTWGKGQARDAVLWVSPSWIAVNPYQPRRTFDESELSSLAESVGEHGVLQPILVRPIGVSQEFIEDPSQVAGIHYQLIAGERRWRASQRAGLEKVPVIVREVSDQQALELAIIENVQRHDISAMDAAVAYKRLAQEFELSQESIAKRVGKSRSSVANTIRLLDLPPEAQQAIQDGAISEGHGRAILLAPDDASRRAALRATLRGKLSVRQTEEFAGRIARQARLDAEARIQPGAVGSSSHSSSGTLAQSPASLPYEERLVAEGVAAQDADALLEEELQRALSCQVQVKRRRSGGQIVLFASDPDQLQRLTEALKTIRL